VDRSKKEKLHRKAAEIVETLFPSTPLPPRIDALIDRTIDAENLAKRDPAAAREIALDVWEESKRILQAPMDEFERAQAQAMIDSTIPMTMEEIAKISRQSGLGEYGTNQTMSMVVVIGVLGLSLWGVFRR